MLQLRILGICCSNTSFELILVLQFLKHAFKFWLFAIKTRLFNFQNFHFTMCFGRFQDLPLSVHPKTSNEMASDDGSQIQKLHFTMCFGRFQDLRSSPPPKTSKEMASDKNFTSKILIFRGLQIGSTVGGDLRSQKSPLLNYVVN